MKTKFIYLSCLLFMISSCAKDIVDTTGSISCCVKDYADYHLIENCEVSIISLGNSATTSSDGSVLFSDLEPGTYTLSFSKVGYEEQTKSVTVTASQISSIAVMLKSLSPFAASKSTIDFEDFQTSCTFYFVNNSNSKTSFKITNIPNWLTLNVTEGIVEAQGQQSIVATVNREKMNYGSYSQPLTVNYSGNGGTNSITIKVNVTKVQQSSPTLTITSTAKDITENSFSVDCKISSTGGAQILDYGICYSSSPNSSIENQVIRVGTTTTETIDYTCTATSLNPNSKYYVRTYEKNTYGVGYSDEITISTNATTEEIGGDDSTAQIFAGGSGTFADPYIIKTGSQLSLVSTYPDKCYILDNDIDLSYNQWNPIKKFSGHFDGNGKTIYNLLVPAIGDDIGLFAYIGAGASVSNLTISGVKIGDSSTNNCGALAGTNHGLVEKCNIIMGEDSYIKGNQNIGGLIGNNGDILDHFECSIESCHVSSTSTKNAILGTSNVGGICGYNGHENSVQNLYISKCKAIVNVGGDYYIGGICGRSGDDTFISDCYYKGALSGKYGIGGILGCGPYISYAAVKITSCKSETNITISNDYAGGILGGGENAFCGVSVIASYTTGSITASSLSKYLGGIAGKAMHIYSSYSTVTSTSASFYGIAGDCKEGIGIIDCITIHNKLKGGYTTTKRCYTDAVGNDIVNKLKNSDEDYHKYWNFNNTWTWSGTIGSKKITVSCPRLQWE